MRNWNITLLNRYMGIQEDKDDVEHVWSLLNGAGLRVTGSLSERLGMRVVEKKTVKMDRQDDVNVDLWLKMPFTWVNRYVSSW